MFLGKQICDNCSESNPAKAMHCDNCGAILNKTISVGESFRDELQQRVAELQEKNRVQYSDDRDNNRQSMLFLPITEKIMLTEQVTGMEFLIENDVADDILIGRGDSEVDDEIFLDLTKVAGWNGGVSRQHASLTYVDDNWYLTDHRSKNGTYLNGKRIRPEQARILHDKDFISFGYVNFLVTCS